MPNNKRKIIITTSIIILFIVTIPIIFFLLNNNKTATLNTTIAPSFATMTIDGESYKINSELKFQPTQTKAIISADGFITQEIELNLQPQKTTTITLYLTPEDGDLKWYFDHPEERILFSTVNDLQAAAGAESYLKEHPIINILPISVSEVDTKLGTIKEYRIDFGDFNDCKTDFCLKITDSSGGNYEAALNLIREKGFNPSDYEIIYEYSPYYDGIPPRP